MSQLVKKLQSGDQVLFDQGKFDQWCVYVEAPSGQRNAPHDQTYFYELQEIAKSYPKNKVYHDFVKIYKRTDSSINSNITNLIDKIVSNYKPMHQLILEKWLSVIYAGMIAEENKDRAILKKRIKRLGMYQVLVQGLKPEFAANFSKGKPWKELNSIMIEKGF